MRRRRPRQSASADPPDGYGSGAFWVVAFAVFVAADDLMVVATMLRPIINDFDLVLPDDLDATAWIVNVYLIAYISAIPLAGRLSDIYGRRAVFVVALIVFMLGSIIVPSADSYTVLLVGRALSAFGGGALVPVALAVAGDLHTGARRVRSLGTLSAIETLGWVWGPLYGAILVRLLTWEWQFVLNVPLAAAGILVGWRVLDPSRRAGARVDWAGAGLLTVALAALNVALLSRANIQTVSGLEELTGRPRSSLVGPWLYGLAAVALVAFVVLERRRRAGGEGAPMIALESLTQSAPAVSLVVNGVVGVGLVIALVNVPLFVNVVETGSGIGSAALLAGWLLTALTATMAVASYLGGRWAGRVGNAVPTGGGLVLAALGFILMGQTWEPETAKGVMAIHLALVGTGVGLVLAPTSAAVMDSAAEADRGTAAGLVIMFRLMGFSVGLAGLTAWGVHRYEVLRDRLELPALGEPGYETALGEAAIDITATALAETFTLAGLIVAAALVGAGFVGTARTGRFPRG